MGNEFFIPPYAEKLYGKPDGFFKGIKVMAIGNSHYCTEGFDEHTRCGKNCPNYMIPGKCGNVNANEGRQNCFTQDVMEEYVAYKSGLIKSADWMSTFTSFAHMFSETCDVIKVWKSLCFYNFLQVAVENNNAQGTPEEIDGAKKHVLAAIELHLPDVIVVWGYKKVFVHLLDVFKSLPTNIRWAIDPENERCGILTMNEKPMKVVCINHPSRAGHEEARNLIKHIAPELITN